MTKQTLRDDFHARFKITDEETGEFIQYAERSDGQSISDFFISRFKEHLEGLADKVEGKRLVHAIPGRRFGTYTQSNGYNKALETASSLIRDSISELE